MSRLGEAYAEGTALAWDRLMVAESAAERAEETRRESLHAKHAARPHRFIPCPDMPAYCDLCGINHRHHRSGA